ncbi:MAG TPA: glycosyltransferase [Solirubrobacterales bacterium]
MLAVVALLWFLAYLTWRVGWSGRGANPFLYAMLLVTEVYALLALCLLAWYSWTRRPAVRPSPTSGRRIDVYVCTRDEPVEVVTATLAGCNALTYPHTTYLLDDGRRVEMEELAEYAGVRYLTRRDDSHAKAGNVNAALPRTGGELVLVLDADHVPMPDALDAMVGYFDDETVAVVQSPHDFFNHDSVQHYAVGRHEQSLFYRVVCPGKDRHDAAYWTGSAALLRRQALLDIGGVATETIAEGFHTTIRLQRHGWKSRYHDEVLVQGLAPHDLDGYLLQRDRWARGNLSVLSTRESPFRARELRPAQRLSHLASLAAYLAPPIRLLLLLTLALVLWTGAVPMKVSVPALATLWLPALALNLLASSALARGYMRSGEATHHELLTMGVYTRALRCALRPAAVAFRTTSKRGEDRGGLAAVRRLPLVVLAAVVLAAGTALRAAEPAGVDLLPQLPGVAAWIVPVLGAIVLWQAVRTLVIVGRHRQRRVVYRFEGDAPAQLFFSEPDRVEARLVDASAAGVGLVVPEPLPVGSRPTVLLELEDSAGIGSVIAATVEVRSCRRGDDGHLVGATIVDIDSDSRMRLMEWCYVVCNFQRLRGHRPAHRVVERERIVVPLEAHARVAA